ncbi:unnamed protein product [Meloidogyne enterolobii]|uniref:Uncharacterized protein n=1 Tax=Meloidogyne enterolobii TaxID=390850 RepID=A0ACB0ZDY7_MELEN
MGKLSLFLVWVPVESGNSAQILFNFPDSNGPFRILFVGYWSPIFGFEAIRDWESHKIE